MITVNCLPLKEIEEVTKGVRSIGLGVMGLADVFYMLDIKYDSEDGYELANDIFDVLSSVSIDESILLVETNQRNAYPLYKESEWSKLGEPIRNSNHISIAPTGSLSFLANVSSGIEPNFALVYTRLTHNGDKYYVVNDIFQKELNDRGIKLDDDLLEKISNNHGSCVGIIEIPKDMQKIFVTAHDIKPRDHVKMVAVIQANVDMGVSKTVNFPSDATVENIMEIYIDAWEQGIKGISIYRDGSRQGQVLSTGTNEEDTPTNILQRGQWATLAPDTTYYKRKIYIGCGKLNLFIGWSDEQQSIQDLYVVRSGNGGCERNLQGMVIAMSGMLRLGGNLFNIEKAFEGIGSCPSFVAQRAKGVKLNVGSSCGTAILNEVKTFLTEVKNMKTNEIEGTIDLKDIPIDDLLIEVVESDKRKCPECGAELRAESGCFTCTCGFSYCG